MRWSVSATSVTASRTWVSSCFAVSGTPPSAKDNAVAAPDFRLLSIPLLRAGWTASNSDCGQIRTHVSVPVKKIILTFPLSLNESDRHHVIVFRRAGSLSEMIWSWPRFKNLQRHCSRKLLFISYLECMSGVLLRGDNCGGSGVRV